MGYRSQGMIQRLIAALNGRKTDSPWHQAQPTTARRG